MTKLRLLVPTVLVTLFPLPVLAEETGLHRCRAIGDASVRLACYDALPLAGASLEPRAQGAKPGAMPQPHATSPQPSLVERFGLEYRPRPHEELPSIESHIPGSFMGWRANQHIRLANGQVWEVIDGSSRFFSRENPKVVVRRGALGSFFLDFEGDNRSPRVRRVQ